VDTQGELDVTQAGISTIWSPVKGLDLSLDVVYSELDCSACNQLVAGTPAKNDIITVWSRIRRNF
ncbi:MAG TPA: hypothetical protein VFY21_09715, partial [Xanthobacteraceae bacterium]|nr:hypothetical protein [Xanthobacteraceae bacterium]